MSKTELIGVFMTLLVTSVSLIGESVATNNFYLMIASFFSLTLTMISFIVIKNYETF